MMESVENGEHRRLLGVVDDDRDNESDSCSTSTTVNEFVVYKRRWFILAVVALLNISNAMMWLSFSTIADKTVKFYDIDVTQVNWLSLVFLIICIPVGILAMWTLDTVGLRSGIILAAWLNMIGAGMRLASCYHIGHSSRYAWLITGQCLAACAQPFLLFAPTKLAALWFKDNQRATANMVASIANPAGVLLSNVISPTVVKQTNDLPLLLIIYFIPAGLAVVMATFGVCSSVPPTPPTSSAAESSQPFWPGLKALVRIRSYLLLAVCFGGGLALFTSLSTLLQQMLCPHGYTDSFVGLCGALLFGIGILGAGLASVYVDRTQRFEEAAKVCFTLAALSCIAFMLLSRHENMQVLLAVTMSVMGLFGFALYPVCLELGVECTYPIAEATTSGFLIISGQIQGIVYIILMEYLALPFPFMAGSTCNSSGATSELPMNYTVSNLVVCGIAVLFSVIFTIFFKCDYKRVQAEQQVIAEKILASYRRPPPSSPVYT